jgi:SAM-dependent methyltransferase
MTEVASVDSSGYHATRFEFDRRREVLWGTLYDAVFARWIPAEAGVLELGAGYGHFINHVQRARRYAVDRWPGFLSFIQPSVTARVGNAWELDFVPDRAIDFALASNLFEHLTKDEGARTLDALRPKLRPGATLHLIQPNYRYAFRQYFDDYTHVTVFSHTSLADFLSAHGFRPLAVVPRFLPLTLKSRWPTSPALIRLYLRSPFRPFAGQMYVRAQLAG